jgi:DHA1 family bicyclomycin/chloramphenicol resistance-like MFS transporter
MAYVGMTLGLCPPTGTVVGGQIHEALGWQANFVLSAGLGVVLFAAAWWGLPRGAVNGMVKGVVSSAIGGAAGGGAVLRPSGVQAVLAGMGLAYAQLLRMPVYLLHVAILGFTTAAFYTFLSGAPSVLRSYGVGPGDVGFFIMVVPLSYIIGNFLTSRLVRRWGGPSLMRLGQGLSVSGVVLMLLLGLAGQHTPWAFVLPLLLLGVGHGLLVPPCLVATVALMPTLAGAASGLAGVTQQLTGALGGYLVGWVSHANHVGLAALMLAATVLASLARLAAVKRGAPTVQAPRP